MSPRDLLYNFYLIYLLHACNIRWVIKYYFSYVEFLHKNALYDVAADLESRGVHCGQNNAEVVAAADVIFLTCLPSQLSLVAEELKDHLAKKDALVWSFVTAVGAERLRSLLRTSNIICPQLTTTKPHDIVNGSTVWDLTAEVTAALAIPQVVEATCPLKEDSTGDWTLLYALKFSHNLQECLHLEFDRCYI